MQVTPSLPPRGYQLVLVTLLTLDFAVVFFDRNALNFLMPFVKPELQLSNMQVGMLASGLSLAWAVAGYVVGRYSDRSGRRKSVIALATLAFAACSFLSGLASSFAMLLGARLLMGFAEGGVLPVSQSLTAAQVDPAHRGLAMGLIQNFGSNLVGSTVAPILLVALATAHGWRAAFFLAGMPGVVIACLVWVFLRDPPRTAGAGRDPMSISRAFAERNILLCATIAVLMISYLVIGWAFLPLYLVQERRFDKTTMGWLIAALGAIATLGSFTIPAISDRLGRRPLMIAVPMAGALVPLAAMFFVGPTWALGFLFALGWAVNGTFSLFLAVIPSETVAARHSATVLGLVLGTGELLGGGVSPFLTGALADRFGLTAPLWAMTGLCIAAGLFAIGLRETAPRIVGRAARGREVSESQAGVA